MAEAQKAPGDARHPAKPSFGNSKKQRDEIKEGAILVLQQEKKDGWSVLSIVDEKGVRHFILPVCGQRLPFRDDLVQKLRAECDGLEGTLHFELYCKNNGRDHNFFGLSGLCNRLQKNYLSIRDFHARQLTLVFLTSSIGRDAIERIQCGEKHFEKGRMNTKSDGSEIWPYEFEDDIKNPIVTVIPCKIFSAHNLEEELARVLQDFQRPESPNVEGVICHMVYPTNDWRNKLRLWGLLTDKNYQYRNPSVMKVKAQGYLRIMITGIFRNKVEEADKPAKSKLPKTSADEPVFKPPPKPPVYCAVVNYTNGAGLKLSTDSIPLCAKMEATIRGALNHQFQVKAHAIGIQWYYNQPIRELELIRHIKVNKCEYDCHHPVDTRPSDNSMPFQYETPQTRRLALLPQAEQDKHKAKLAGKRAEKEEKMKDGDGWNHKKHCPFTSGEMKRKDKFNLENLEIFKSLQAVFALPDEAAGSASSAPRAPRVKTAQELTDIACEISIVCELINRHRENNLYVEEGIRSQWIKRAAAVGKIVGVDIMWPVVASKAFVHKAWRCTFRNFEQSKALKEEQEAVTRIIRMAAHKSDYFNKDQRTELMDRADNCGLKVTFAMWPKLTLVQSKNLQKAFWKLDVDLLNNLPQLTPEMQACWKPLPSPDSIDDHVVDLT